MSLDPAFLASVVEHMNDDHADAMLAWVRAGDLDAALDAGPDAPGSDAPGIVSVRMASIDARGVTLDCLDTAGDTRRRRLALEPPLADAAGVRARLVAMTREARAALERAAADRDD